MEILKQPENCCNSKIFCDTIECNSRGGLIIK